MKGGSAIPTIWIISNIALWVLVLFETGLLLLLLRALGELRQKGGLSASDSMPVFDIGGLDIGKKAPPFVATDYEGTIVKFEDFQGQRRILSFILPGCPACSGAIEALNNVLQNEPDLSVLVVGGPDSNQNRVYASEHGARMLILTAASDLIRERYNVRIVPFVFVLDEADVVRAKGNVSKVEDIQQLLKTAFTLLPVSGSLIPGYN